MKNRILSFILAILMIVSIVPASVFAAPTAMFSDVSSHWAKDTIEELAGKGIINGKGNGIFDPSGTVKRGEFIKLLVSVFGTADAEDTGELKDMSNHWAKTFVYEAMEKGIVTVDDLVNYNFLPNEPADRETVVVWTVRALGIYKDDVSINFADANKINDKQSVAIAVDAGLINGYPEDNTFRPENTLTRAESAVIIKRVITYYETLTGKRESANRVDYSDTVSVFDAENSNVLMYANYETGEYRFEKIDDQIKNLKAGDVFVIEPCENVPYGLAIKVKSIVVDGDKATIMQGDLQMSDVIDEIDFSLGQDIDFESTKINYVPGVSVEQVGDDILFRFDNEVLIDEYGNGTILPNYGDEMLVAGIGDWLKELGDKAQDTYDRVTNLELVNTGYSTTINADVHEKIEESLGKNAKLTGEFKLIDPKIALDVYYSLLSKNEHKNHAVATVETGYDMSLILDVEASKETRIELCEMDVILGTTPFTAGVEFYFVVGVSGEISVGYEQHLNVKYGVNWTPSNGPTLVHELNKSSKAYATAAGSANAGVEGCVNLALLGEVFKIYVGCEFGVEGKAETVIANVENNLNVKMENGSIAVVDELSGTVAGLGTGSVELGLDNEGASFSHDEKAIHACSLCVDGAVGLYMNVKFGASAVEKELFEEEMELFDMESMKLAEFYVSFMPNKGITVGLGQCPFMFLKPVITSHSESTKKSAGSILNLEMDAYRPYDEDENAKIKTSKLNDKTGLSYAWYKDGKLIEGKNLPTCDITVTKDTAGTYKGRVFYEYFGKEVLYAETEDIVIEVQAVENAPKFTVQPKGETIEQGDGFGLTSWAEGEVGGYVAYQWYKDGAPIAGATSSGYSVMNATQADAGSYYCEAFYTDYPDLKSQSNIAVITIKGASSGTTDDGVRDVTGIFGDNNTDYSDYNTTSSGNNDGGVRDVTNLFN